MFQCGDSIQKLPVSTLPAAITPNGLNINSDITTQLDIAVPEIVFI